MKLLDLSDGGLFCRLGVIKSKFKAEQRNLEPIGREEGSS